MNDDVRARARAEIDKLPGLKYDALIKLGPCAVCGMNHFETPDLTFYVVRIRRGAWMADNVRQAAHLQGAFGPLASVMGPDKDLAKLMPGEAEVFIHECCAGNITHILELIPHDDEPSESDERDEA